jgi:DNA-binding CsgD family transcriptional regulator/tetratricopeptide (TPR) repeat protein
MGVRLVERDAELETLVASLDSAAAGRGGSAILVLGEAGIGKTSLVRAFVASVDGAARVLAGACDDLLTPRTFGPLRDAASSVGGSLAEALAGEPDRESVYAALLDELSRSGPPTILVVEDIHWADDATLDALRFVARRLERLRAIVVLTYRDDERLPDHLRQLLGVLIGPPVRRLVLHRLSEEAVAELSRSSGVSSPEIYATTRGNPFFVSELLAAQAAEVPATVVDAVLGRVHQLSPDAQRAIDQLAVVPSHVEGWLVTTLLGGMESVAEAEQRGIVELRPEGVTFRHELARQALERSMPALRRMEFNRAVVDALLERDDADLSRIVHHAVAAGDVDTILSRGPSAAREAAHAGAHRQALAHYEHVVEHVDALPDDAKAQILVEYAWQLYAAYRFVEAVDVAERAAQLWDRIGERVAFGEALVAVSRASYMADRPGPARAAIEEAVRVLASTGNTTAQAYAQTYHGAVLSLTDQSEAALEQLALARELAERSNRPDLVALCLDYVGWTRVALGDELGVDDLWASLELAKSITHYEYVARAYTNLGEALYYLRDHNALQRCIAEGIQYCTDHDLPAHAYSLRAHSAMLMMVRGDLEGSEKLLRDLVAGVPDAGQLARLTLPTLGRVLARRGSPEAEQVLDQAWEIALRGDALLSLAPAGLARIEWAWLTGDVARAQPQIDVLLDRTAVAAGFRWRGQLLRYLSRAGRPAEPFAGCPEEWASGLRGDWRTAAERWKQIGDPYERALELAESGEAVSMLESLEVLDRLGATAAAHVVRHRLRSVGVSRIPRARQLVTPANPWGLTSRQLDVLGLLAEGLTNAEIAEQLVLSTRTVDHHVSAILTRLGAATRRDAVRMAAALPLPGN